MGDLLSIAATVARYGLKISLYSSIALIVPIFSIYVLHKLERRQRLNIPGIPAVPSPKSSDYRKVLHDANQKVQKEICLPMVMMIDTRKSIQTSPMSFLSKTPPSSSQ